ncbi:adenylate/guanylate cyclase domain-containing protein [Nitrososphaera sp.]|uniref:adenylate/guanylate cyclase domain-containing protein n=1 Tax=Nitrososphaera sp. TaxID=1971748 RepID=UPI002EDA6427
MTDGATDPGFQRQTIINLFTSGIDPDTIALQLDISKDQVEAVIASFQEEEKKKTKSATDVAAAPSFSSFPLDGLVDKEEAVKQAQERVWKALKFEPEFDLTREETQTILEKFVKSKVEFVILHIDLVGSTKLSMTLPADRLANIVQAFTQEMSIVIKAYGGFILKYVGDAILAFFLADRGNLRVPCQNAVACANAMIRVMQQGINPILNQYDYPELNVRVGIDVGDNVVVQYGWDTTMLEDGRVIRKPHLDILGYTISVTAKMTSFAMPGQVVIGEFVYEALADEQKGLFKPLVVSTEVWEYMSDYTGKIYQLYGSV